VIGTSQVSDLAAEGRNVAALTEEVAGITIAPTAQADQGNTKTFPVVYTISANGTFVGQTNYMLDGGNNVDEYTNVNAALPHARCAAGIQRRDQQLQRAVRPECRRRGQHHHQERHHQYHGDLFELSATGVFNAAQPLHLQRQNQRPKPVDPLKRNQFGGTVGGPLEIPHLYTATSRSSSSDTKGRSFTRPHCRTATIILPTIAQAGANSSGTAPGTNNLVFTDCVKDPPKDKLTERYFSDAYILQGVLNPANLLTYQDYAQNNYYNSLISETHTFSGHIVNNFIISYQLDRDSRGPISNSVDVADLGVKISQPGFKQINQISVSGFFTIGGNPQAFFDPEPTTP
jgi:hypothetical protein